MDFAPWVDSHDESFAMIAERLPPALDEVSWMFNGNDRPLEGLLPEGTVLDLSIHGGKKLGDSVRNIHNMLVVSERLREILERNSDDFEFHAVSIRNHKGRKERKPFFIAQLLLSVPCLDLARSEVHWGSMDPGQALYITRLVLDESKIPADKKIFRLGEMKKLVLVRRDLGMEIYREKECRGMLFQKIDLYGREFREE